MQKLQQAESLLTAQSDLIDGTRLNAGCSYARKEGSQSLLWFTASSCVLLDSHCLPKWVCPRASLHRRPTYYACYRSEKQAWQHSTAGAIPTRNAASALSSRARWQPYRGAGTKNSTSACSCGRLRPADNCGTWISEIHFRAQPCSSAAASYGGHDQRSHAVSPKRPNVHAANLQKVGSKARLASS